MFKTIKDWYARRQQRKALADLGERVLAQAALGPHGVQKAKRREKLMRSARRRRTDWTPSKGIAAWNAAIDRAQAAKRAKEAS